MKAGVILSKFFNTAGSPVGYEKRPIGDFAAEVRALTPDEKIELVTLAAKEMDVEVTA
jgi:exonuclease VII large subunit